MGLYMIWLKSKGVEWLCMTQQEKKKGKKKVRQYSFGFLVSEY